MKSDEKVMEGEAVRVARLATDISVALAEAGSSESDIQRMLQKCCASIVDHLDAAFARIWTLESTENILHLQASAGIYTHLDGPHSRVPVGKFKIGLIAQERQPHLTNEVLSDPRVSDKEWAKRESMVAFAGYPLIVEDQLIGVVALFSRQPQSQASLAALGSVANIIALGIVRKRAAEALAQQGRINETLYRISRSLASKFDVHAVVQLVTDETTKLSGAQFGAFFYNVINQQGESYTLYTISGVPREHFSKFPMPRNTQVFAPTFEGSGIVRSEDITKDERYGHNPPYFGMPKGHLPVRSYLAVPVISRTGEVLGGLFYGHSNPGVFTAHDESLVSSIAVQAAVAIDNARLYERALTAEASARRELARSRAITDALGEGVYSYDLEGRITFLNPAGEALLGWPQAEVVHKPVSRLFRFANPDTGALDATAVDVLPPQLISVLQEGKTIRSDEEFFVRRDRTPLAVAYTASPLREAENIVGGVVAFNDISERKKSEAELRESFERYRLLARATNDVIRDWNLLTNSITWNEALEQAFGYRSDQSYADADWWKQMVHPADRERVISGIQDVISSGSTYWSDEYRFRRNDGSYATVYDRGYVLHDQSARPVRMIGSMLDLTERLQAEQELRDARDQALEASRAKSTFLANMSHELRTPLNAIIGYSEMLQEQASEDGRENLAADLNRIQLAGRHLLALINDILDLSKIEAGKMEVYVSRFNVHELVNEVVATVQPLAEKNGNRLIATCAPSIDAMQADETKVRQVLFNLLSNAAKFTENGEISLTVDREQAERGGKLLFRISDSGIGMSEQQVSQLFREFTQVDPSTTRRHGGTGLGLAISRRFCRMMGGDIDVVSALGQGSTFTARLPMMVAGRTSTESDTLTGVADDQNDVSSLTTPPRGNSLNSVLVIDDDPSVHDLLRRLLEKESFRYIGATSGRRGVELAREIQPRAIILDVMMPEMDGWSVLTELKNDPHLADIPVIIVSIVDDKNLAFALGATDYLTKPVERDRLLSVLRKYHCDLGNCRVLVVEDDPDSLQLLVRLLGAAGCLPVAARDGTEALSALETQPFDMILLDLMMPGMDGFEFIEAKRKVAQWKEIPVVVVTARELNNADRERLNGSVEKVLRKGNYSRDELLHELCNTISKT